MTTTASDILGYVRRLKEAGVPEPQAEVHVQIIADAFSQRMESLVTREYLDQRLEARFAAQDLVLEKRFSALEGELKLQRWILAAIAASTVLPALMQLFAS